MNAKVRIAIVGLGWWATRAHVPAVLANELAELVGLVDRDHDRRALLTSHYGVPVHATFDDLVAATQVDAVVVATPPAAHHEVARQALESGCHVLVEKPMVLDPGHASELCDIASLSGLHLLVGYPWHFNPQVLQLRSWVQEGALGEVEYMATTFASVVRDLYAGRVEAAEAALGYPVVAPAAASYSDPAVAGGGQGQTQLTHSLALLLHLTGLEPVEVFAYMNSRGLDVDLVDALSIRFAGGALGVVGATGGSHPLHPELHEYRVYGTAGHAHLDVNGGRLTLFRGDGAVVEADPPTGDAGYPEHGPVDHLVDLVTGRTDENLIAGCLGADVVRLLAAAYRSASSARPISAGAA